jgi:hypothetical protein
MAVQVLLKAFLTSAPDGADWPRSRFGRFNLGTETRYTVYMRVDARHMQFRKNRRDNLSLPEIESIFLGLTTGYYTNLAIPTLPSISNTPYL